MVRTKTVIPIIQLTLCRKIMPLFNLTTLCSDSSLKVSQVVKGEMSAKTTYQRSAKGAVSILYRGKDNVAQYEDEYIAKVAPPSPSGPSPSLLTFLPLLQPFPFRKPLLATSGLL